MDIHDEIYAIIIYCTTSLQVQMLHCISQTVGGDSVFVDGFHIAQKMAAQYPHHYKILTSVPVVYEDIGVDYVPFHEKAVKPTVR